MQSNNVLKTSTPKHQHGCRKGSKKGDTIDAKTRKTKIPKQVFGNVMKIIKIMFFFEW